MPNYHVEQTYFNSSSKLVFVGGTLCALFLYFATRSQIHDLHIWLITMLFAQTFTFLYWQASKSLTLKAARFRITIYWFLLGVCDLNWAYITYFKLPHLTADLVAFVCVFVCGISSAIMLMYLPARRMTSTLMISVTLPFCLGVLNSPFSFAWQLAGLTTLYTIVLIYSAVSVQKIYIREIDEQQKNIKLIEELQSKTIDVIANAKTSMLIDMASGMAHEINNPLTTVTIQLDILEHNLRKIDIDPNNLQKSVMAIRKSVERITEITKNLSYFFNSNAQDYLSDETIGTILRDLSIYFHKKTNGKVARLTLNYPDVPVVLRCNKTEITQALKHLVNNAIEAFETQDTLKNHIHLDCRKEQDTVLIAISDNGRGIPKDIIDKIMHPFFTTKEVGKGLGLGLSIANSIIRNHKGSIRMDSQNQETHFVVQLPAKEGPNDYLKHA